MPPPTPQEVAGLIKGELRHWGGTLRFPWFWWRRFCCESVLFLGGVGVGEGLLYRTLAFFVVQIIEKRLILWKFLSEGNKKEDGLDDSLHILNWINTIWNITIKPPLRRMFLKLFASIEANKSKFVVTYVLPTHGEVAASMMFCFYPDLSAKFSSPERFSNDSLNHDHHHHHLCLIGSGWMRKASSWL